MFGLNWIFQSRKMVKSKKKLQIEWCTIDWILYVHQTKGLQNKTQFWVLKAGISDGQNYRMKVIL